MYSIVRMATLPTAELMTQPPRIRLLLQLRERELIALRKTRRELEVMAKEAKLQLGLAELDAKEENLILDEEQSQIYGRKRESHRSNTSIKKYAKPLPNVSQTLPTVSQPTFISSNLTNVKDIGHTMYSTCYPTYVPL